MSSALVRMFGFPATLIHGDPLVLDRWFWLSQRLPKTTKKEKLLDVGCGSGAFSIGLALRGYDVLGLSWDERNQNVAGERAQICRADSAQFQVQDVRLLKDRLDLKSKFDIAICLEVIEHVLDDKQLLQSIFECLRPGGRVLLTTPNFDYKAITPSDDGPFLPVEDGRHVRKGYTGEELSKLCTDAGFVVQSVSSCSGFFSQKITYLWRVGGAVHPLFGFALTLPLRVIPPLFDPLAGSITSWPPFSICLEGYKPDVSQ